MRPKAPIPKRLNLKRSNCLREIIALVKLVVLDDQVFHRHERGSWLKDQVRLRAQPTRQKGVSLLYTARGLVFGLRENNLESKPLGLQALRLSRKNPKT
jgi:hypothetical protein